MKKIVSPLLFLLFAASLDAQPQSDIDASKLIDLVNAVTTLSSEYAKKYDNYRNVLSVGAEKYEQLQEHYNPDSPVNFKSAGFFPVNAGFLDAYRETLEALPATVKEKSAIEAAVKTAREKTAGLERWGKGLRQYFVDKSFASDDFAGYQTAKDSLEYYFTETRKAWRNALNIAAEAGDNAEIQLLKGSPIVQFLSPMKSDLRLLKVLLGDFYDRIEAEDYDFTGLKEDIAELNASVVKNKSVSDKNISILSHVDYYTSYYDKVGACADALTFLIDEISKDDPADSQVGVFIGKIAAYYDETIDSYHNFIKYASN